MHKFLLALIAVCLLPCSATARDSEPNPNASSGVAKLSAFAGQWDLTTYDRMPDGSVAVGKANSDAYFILDGYALQDDFRVLDETGRVVFRGTSIRTYDSTNDRWLVRWLMVDDPGMTEIEGEFTEDGRFVGTGKGSDGVGDFLERFTYTFPSEDRYVFVMSRSYDGGQTWLENFNRIEAVRR